MDLKTLIELIDWGEPEAEDLNVLIKVTQTKSLIIWTIYKLPRKYLLHFRKSATI